MFAAKLTVLLIFIVFANCGRQPHRSKKGCERFGKVTQKQRDFTSIEALNKSDLDKAFGKELTSGEIYHSCLRDIYRWRTTRKLAKVKVVVTLTNFL